MASLFKLSDHYYLQFYDAAKSPDRKRIALGVRDRRTAERLRIEHEAAYVRGEFDPWTSPSLGSPSQRTSSGSEGGISDRLPDQSPTRLSEATSLLLAEKAAEGKSPNTVRSYRAVLSLLRRRIGDIPISDLAPAHVRAFVRDDAVSATTNRNRYRHLRAAVRWWGKRGLLGSGIDPLENVMPPKVPARVPKAVTADELESICEAIREAYEELVEKRCARRGELLWRIPLFRFAFATGMRSSELARLRWRHIDRGKRLITIERQKNGRAQTIPLTKEAARVLEDVRAGTGDDFVFRSPRFETIERSTQRFVEASAKAFRTARLRAGIARPITVHSLRHGFCTRLAEAGLPAYVIMEAARHADIQTSMTYVSLTRRMLRDRLDVALYAMGD